jgi:CheY-like chemotaxis protein
MDALSLNTVESSDWPDTLRKAAVHRPDLVLVSEDLPQLNTLQMCLQLRGIGGMFKTPLVLILADQADELTPEAMRRARIDEAIARAGLRRKFLEVLRRYVPISGAGEVVSGLDVPEVVGGLPIMPDGTVGSASGEIGHPSAAALLGQLARRWSTGTLVFERDRHEIRIYLHRGNIVDASSNLPGLDLESLVRSNRLVSESDLAKARVEVKASGGLLTMENSLLAHGWIDPQRLQRVQLYQRQHAVLLPLSWRTGRFAFEPGSLEPAQLTTGFGTVDLLLGGLRSLRDAEKVAAGLPPPNSALKRSRHAFDGFQASKLSDAERNVLLLADEGATVEAILAQPRLDSSEAMRAICGLYASGVIELLGSEPAPSAKPAAPGFGNHAESDEVAIEEGSLTGLPVAKLLTELYGDKRTGVLFLLQEDELKEVYLERGRIVAAQSNRREDGWPGVLFRRGLLMPAECKRLERRLSLEPTSSTLPLRQESLVWRLQPQWMRIEDIVHGLFDRQNGSWRFEEGRLPDHEIVLDRTESLLLEGIRRLGVRAWSTTSLPPQGHFVAARPDAFALELGPSEARLVATLNGQITIHGANNLSDELEIDVQPLLHGLVLLGLVRTAPQPIPVDQVDLTERRRKNLLWQIQEFEPRAEGENYFAILSVSADAPMDVIKARYKLLRERFHPDRAQEIGLTEALDPLSDLFGRIYLAYQTLSKPEARQAHLEDLERQAARGIEARP